MLIVRSAPQGRSEVHGLQGPAQRRFLRTLLQIVELFHFAVQVGVHVLGVNHGGVQIPVAKQFAGGRQWDADLGVGEVHRFDNDIHGNTLPDFEAFETERLSHPS